MTDTGSSLTITKVTDAYWRVIISNPPINLYDPRMFADLRIFMDAVEQDPLVKIVVFESADPDFFIAHYDVVRGQEMPNSPGAAPFTEWPDFVARLSQSQVVSVALIRGRTRGHGSEFALACDMRFASLEKATFGQIELGLGVVPGGGAIDWLSRLAGRSRTLEIVLGADDFSALNAERYGWINRALPDDELDGFVDNLAKRVAGFDKQAIQLAKRLINARSNVVSESDLRDSNLAFIQSTQWSEVQPRVARALQLGLQQPGDYELNLGTHLADLHEQTK
ncbi:enoyl-CoA hydratase/isomerase family protein [Pseudomonas sp. T8]|uniref:enoyl-CoA hydratase/isomerase family protein n=1 Tax=Pseudomonas sp. T8 TaxID=645292 RepID=UPI002148106C|nr:enoyl-CoA hydratase/isomerase family protein [Pseudomonas sp. T8]UUT22916.1 enoyl-CoA hydratase/isomerase family protein [Pseudomonas sp. T8]